MIVERQAPKKSHIKITGLKDTPPLPPDYEEQEWMRLEEAVHAIQQGKTVAISPERLYRGVENLCIHKLSEKLFERLRKECDEQIGQSVALLIGSLTLEPVQFLEQMEQTWQRHCFQMKRIALIFEYLDRTYVLTASGMKSLFNMGLQLFRGHLSVHPDVQEKTLAGLLMVIEDERKGFAVDRSILKSLLVMCSSIGIYESHFQERFLEQTARFYREESEHNLLNWDIPQYLLYCENRLEEERDRSEQYLDRMTHRPLIQCVEMELLSARIETILEGFEDLMETNRTSDLARLFQLCSKSHHSLQREQEMVLMLLDFKTKLDNVLYTSFKVDSSDRNNEFQQALKDAFEKFINQKENKPAELTAKFIDSKLKAGNKGQTEEELEMTLDRVLTIFRFIQGKDVFEAFYKKDLAKRLLFSKNSSIDAEKSMIAKLKEECGSQFTNKLEGMFNDMEISKELMESFKNSPAVVDKIKRFSSEMNVQVLTCGYWPTYPVLDAHLPDELAEYQEIFKDFYLRKHNGRRLQWHNNLGTCIIRARFRNNIKELQASFFQAIVLLLFNDRDEMTYFDIKQQTCIEEKELKRLIVSLCFGKLRILQKTTEGNDVNDMDVIAFNEDFHDQRYRIRINTLQIKESNEENQKVNDAVLQDRQYQIDAAIVRIMKMRKTLSHKLLVSELTMQLKFPFKTIDIKKRIESLIEREYMDRTTSDPGVYEYVA